MGETLEKEILQVIAELTDTPEISPGQRLDGLRADSMALMRLISVLQERFDIAIDVVDVFTAEQAGDIVAVVRRLVASA